MSATVARRRWPIWAGLLVWLLPRLVVLAVWLAVAPSVQGDVWYYWRSLRALPQHGIADTMREYPTPVLALLGLPFALGLGDAGAFAYLFIGGLLLLDGLFALSLWRRYRRTGGGVPWALVWWSAFTFLLGPTAYLRFDLVTAVLVGWALLALADRRAGRAGALIAVGAGLKLWPALLYLGLLGRRGERRRASLAFWGTGIGLVLASVVAGGLPRLVSPLVWQSKRGLQIESVWATVPMIMRLVTDDYYDVSSSIYQAFEILGPFTWVWLKVATASLALGLLAIAAVTVVWLRGPNRGDVGVAALLMLFITAVMITTNKTFSPQYVMWLGGPLAALLAQRARPFAHKGIRPLAITVLVLTALTQLVYPVGYYHLVRLTPLTPLFTGVLAARNVLMLGFTGWLGARALTAARR